LLLFAVHSCTSNNETKSSHNSLLLGVISSLLCRLLLLDNRCCCCSSSTIAVAAQRVGLTDKAQRKASAVVLNSKPHNLARQKTRRHKAISKNRALTCALSVLIAAIYFAFRLLRLMEFLKSSKWLSFVGRAQLLLQPKHMTNSQALRTSIKLNVFLLFLVVFREMTKWQLNGNWNFKWPQLGLLSAG